MLGELSIVGYNHGQKVHSQTNTQKRQIILTTIDSNNTPKTIQKRYNTPA